MRIFAVPRWVFGFWTWNLTRDLAQVPQDTQSWTLSFFFQPTYGRPNGFPDPLIGKKKCTKMCVFFCVHLCVSWWARAQSRVKSSISNSQNWAGHSDIGKIMASWPAQLVDHLDTNLPFWGAVQGGYITDPTQATCPRACSMCGSYPAAWARSHRSGIYLPWKS